MNQRTLLNGSLAAWFAPKLADHCTWRTYKMSEKSIAADWSERCGNRSLDDGREESEARWKAQWKVAKKTLC